MIGQHVTTTDSPRTRPSPARSPPPASPTPARCSCSTAVPSCSRLRGRSAVDASTTAATSTPPPPPPRRPRRPAPQPPPRRERRRPPTPRQPTPPTRSTRAAPAPPTPRPGLNHRHDPREDPPMLRSLFASISGLRAHQTMMDVTANNIANVNTQGFKSGRAIFADALAQTVRGGGIPRDGSGSTNPMQIGLGSRDRRGQHPVHPGQPAAHRADHRSRHPGRRVLPRRARRSRTADP